MNLTLDNLKEFEKIVDSFPKYDVKKLREESIKDPKWVHFGAGNIFRGYIARLNEDLLNENLFDRGISVIESFDEEIVEKIYKRYDNLVLSVTLNKEGKFKIDLLPNLVEALVFSKDEKRIEEIFLNENLELVSFTITEKGYNLYAPNGEVMDIVKEDTKSIKNPKHLMSKLAKLLYLRFKNTNRELTLVSMDNCSENGKKLKDSITFVSNAWVEEGLVEKQFLDYLDKKVSFPWSMIDKITPRPAVEVKEYLNKKSIEDIDSIKTEKSTFIAPFVNSEEAEYLVIEDSFKNNRPHLERVGVYLTDRETVKKVETMKVTTCLNPLHTALAVYGCLLGYESISSEMEDESLVSLIKNIGYNEALKVVEDPKILSPKEFIDEVVEERLPNPYIPDTPQRIATDTSQKVAIRFGETIKKYAKNNEVDKLKYIPLAIAGWLRYLVGVNDEGEEFELSTDPLMEKLKEYFKNVGFKDKADEKLESLLENENIFGINLKEIGLSDLIIKYFNELNSKEKAVKETLEKYRG